MSTNLNGSDEIPNDSRQTSAPRKNNTQSQQVTVLRITRRVLFCQMSRTKYVGVGMGCFTLMVITAGILIVYLTSRQRTDATCQAMFAVARQTSTSSNSNPQFVAIADLNNDTHLDAVVAAVGTDQILVFLGFGNGSFALSVPYSTGRGSSPKYLAIADVNNDGLLDIAVANHATHNIGILLGAGNGTFQAQQTFSTGASRPLSVVIGDVNNDHRADTVFVSPHTLSVGVLIGRGDGSFGQMTSYSTGFDSFPRAAVLADLNNDSRIDIAVVNRDTDNVGLFLSHGNGSFAAQVILPLAFGSRPSSLVVGDYNNDQTVDIVVANGGMGGISLLLGYGNGSFTSAKTLATGPKSSSVFVNTADLNNDGALDIVVVHHSQDTIGVFLSYTNGSFSTERTYTTQPGPCSVAFGDLNEDRRLDLLVVTNTTNSLGVFLGYYSVDFPTRYTRPTGTTAGLPSLAVGDFDHDNQSDVIFANMNTSDIRVFRGWNNGSFSNERIYSSGNRSGPSAIAAGHLNDDTHLDFAVTNSIDRSVSIFLGAGNLTFSEEQRYSTGNGSSPSAIALADVNGDDRLDMIVVNTMNNSVGVFLASADRTFSGQIQFFTGVGSRPQSVLAGDLSNDGVQDVLVANAGANNVMILLGSGNGSFVLSKTYSTMNSPVSIAMANVNNDAHLDFVVMCFPTETVDVFIGQDDGSFFKRTVIPYQPLLTYGFLSVLLADFDTDGVVDLACISKYGAISISRGYNNGSFASAKYFSFTKYTNATAYAFTAGYFNDDNRLDLVTVSGQLDVLLSYDYGFLQASGVHATGSATVPVFVAFGDFDNDTRLDIVVANSGTDDFTLVFRHDQINETRVSTGFASHPHALAVADFNNDRRPDIVVANSGTDNVALFLTSSNNTFIPIASVSMGTKAAPESIVVGDLNHDPWLDIAVTNPGKDSIAVLFSYDRAPFINQTSYMTIPGLEPRSVVLGDFDLDGQLDAAIANWGYEQLFVLRGHPNGTFTVSGAYSTSDGSFPQRMVAADLNRDGRLDLVVTHLYMGDVGIFYGLGNGSFSAEVLHELDDMSDPYALVIDDFNNDARLDLVVVTELYGLSFLLLGDGEGGFATAFSFSTEENSICAAAGDFNKDQRLDLIIGNDNGEINMYFGNGNGTFLRTPMTYEISSFAGVRDLVVADLNNDTWMDVAAVTNSASQNVVVFLGSVGGSLSSRRTYESESDSFLYSVILADLNNDNRLDIVFSTSGRDSIRTDPRSLIGYKSVGVLLGWGNGSFMTSTIYATGSNSGPFPIAIGHFNNDSRRDILIVDIFKKNLCTLFGSTEIALALPTTYSTGKSSHPRSLTVGDFNHDHHLDIAVTNTDLDTICIFRGLANGSLVNGTTFAIASGSSPYSIVTDDMNNDGRLDLVVGNFNSDNIMMFAGRGDGTFSYGATYFTGLGSAPSSVVVVDLNGDRWLDIVVTYYGTSSLGVLPGQGNGSVVDPLHYSLGFNTRPTSVAVGDLNDDGLLDIVITDSGSSNLAFVLRMC